MTVPSTDTTQVRVALVDDQQLVRAGFRMVIDSQPDLRVEVEAGDGAQAVRLLSDHPVDVVLMDVRMPQLDGLAATAHLTAAWHERLPADQQPKILTGAQALVESLGGSGSRSYSAFRVARSSRPTIPWAKAS